MEVRLPPLVPALHCAPSALPPLVHALYRAPSLVHALHRAPSAHPISRSRPLSPPSTAHRPRTRYRAPAPCPRPPPRTVRAPDIALPPLVHACPRPPPRTVRAPDIALPPLVHALHRPPPRTVRAPSAHPIWRSRPLSPPSTAHRPRTRYRAPAPCPRPPPHTVRAPRTRTRTVRAPDIKAPPPFSLLKLFRQDRARYRAPRVGALNENPTPEGFSGTKLNMKLLKLNLKRTVSLACKKLASIAALRPRSFGDERSWQRGWKSRF